jgi:hypothetical protein
MRIQPALKYWPERVQLRCERVCACARVRVCMCLYVCMRVYMCVHACVCVYICVCVHMHLNAGCRCICVFQVSVALKVYTGSKSALSPARIRKMGVFACSSVKLRTMSLSETHAGITTTLQGAEVLRLCQRAFMKELWIDTVGFAGR